MLGALFSASSPKSLLRKSWLSFYAIATLAIGLISCVAGITRSYAEWQHASSFFHIFANETETLRRLDKMAAAFPDTLRVLVRRNGTVTINKPTPFGLALAFFDSPYHVLFESPATLEALQAKYPAGNSHVSAHAIVSGDKLLLIDHSAFSPSQSSAFLENGLVPLTYRALNLSTEPAIEAPLSALCEALSDPAVELAMHAESQLRQQLAAPPKDAKQAPGKTVAPLSAMISQGFDGALRKQVLVGDAITKRSLMYYNQTALLERAHHAGMNLIEFRAHQLWQRLQKQEDRALAIPWAVAHSTGRLLGLHPYVHAPSTSQLASVLHIEEHQHALSSAYVCTKDTLQAAVADMKANSRSQQWVRTFAAQLFFSLFTLLAMLENFGFLAVSLAISVVALYPLLALAANTQNMTRPIPLSHLLRISVICSLPFMVYVSVVSPWYASAPWVKQMQHIGYNADDAYGKLLVFANAVLVLACIAQFYDQVDNTPVIERPPLLPVPPVAPMPAEPHAAERRILQSKLDDSAPQPLRLRKRAAQSHPMPLTMQPSAPAPVSAVLTVLSLQQEILQRQAHIHAMLAEMNKGSPPGAHAQLMQPAVVAHATQ
jgi:hypothetical protein